MDLEQTVQKALADVWGHVVYSLGLVAEKHGRRSYRAHTDDGPLFVKAQDLQSDDESNILDGLRVQHFLRSSNLPVSEPLNTRDGRPYLKTEDYLLTVERWLEHEELQTDLGQWQALGELCARLHCLPATEEIRPIVSRLDPAKTLNGLRSKLAAYRNNLPAEYNEPLARYLEEAESLAYFEHLPRVLIHSDLTWDNVVFHRGVLHLIDLEGAGMAPAVMDLVEVTTKLCRGHSASGPLDKEATLAFYRGYLKHRRIAETEIAALPAAHFFQEIYYLENSLGRGDYDFLNRMAARLQNWRGGAFEFLAAAASGKA